MLIPFMLGSVVGLASTGPVRVESCQVTTPIVSIANNAVNNASPVVTAGSVRIRFVNTSGQPVTHVDFALNDGATIDDAGTFSPGVTIDKTIALWDFQAQSCDIADATLSDGQTWTAQSSSDVGI
jgi:hypothetical protein